MRELAKSVAGMLLEHNDLIFYASMTMVVVIMAISVFNAWRRRYDVVSSYANEEEGCESGDDDNWEDNEPVTLTRVDYFVDVYCPNLIRGMIVSTIFLVLVSIPFVIISSYL